MMNSIDMTVWRTEHPKAMLPAFFDDVDVLHRPSPYVDPATRIWIAAIFWSVGDESVTILDQHEADEAEYRAAILRATAVPGESRAALHGQPYNELESDERARTRAAAHVDERRQYETQYPRADRPS